MGREIEPSLEHLPQLLALFWPSSRLLLLLLAQTPNKSHHRFLGALCVTLADTNGLVVGKSEKVAPWYETGEGEKAVRGIY